MCAEHAAQLSSLRTAHAQLEAQLADEKNALDTEKKRNAILQVL